MEVLASHEPCDGNGTDKAYPFDDCGSDPAEGMVDSDSFPKNLGTPCTTKARD
jgi:hypothetical protein